MTRSTHIVAAAVLCGVMLVPAFDADAAPDVYVVRPGDSLSAIAGRFDVDLSDLLRTNNLTMTSVILPGQQLQVPRTSTASGDTSGSSYVVRPGDWLGRIASRHGVTLSALLQANGLTASSVILPGQRLAIPVAGGGGPSGSASGSYTVRPGDWLARIAARHGVSLEALLDANGLNVDSLILPGQTLRIPRDGADGSPSPAPAPADGATYTVVAGDSLSAIASRHRVPLTALLAVNGFTVDTVIVPGMQVRLPRAPTSSGIDRVVAYALAQVGKPWRFFTRGPSAFDCSGLTLAAYEQVGVSLLHYSAAQAWRGTAVDFHRQPIRPGDLVFQDTNGDGVINHVGIAISSTRWVEARDSRTDVSVSRIPPDRRIVAVRRLLASG